MRPCTLPLFLGKFIYRAGGGGSQVLGLGRGRCLGRDGGRDEVREGGGAGGVGLPRPGHPLARGPQPGALKQDPQGKGQFLGGNFP